MTGARSAWTNPSDILAAVHRLWDSGALLAARLDGGALFPYALRLRQPGVAVMGEQFELVRPWVAALKAGSRPERSHGYALHWRDINHRQLVRNSIPFAALIDSEADALHTIGHVNDARRFDAQAACASATWCTGATSIPTVSRYSIACARPCRGRARC